jgi:hypothetical protein
VKDWVVPIAVALITGALGSGLLPLIQAFRGRGRARVDAVDVLSDTAREWVTDFKAEAQSARAETQALRTEVNRVREEATALANELHRIRIAILAPTATLDGLRDLVRRGAGPTANGRT